MALLDTDLRVLATEKEGRQTGAGTLRPGHRVDWTVAAQPSSANEGWIRVTLRLPDGEYLACARELPDRPGFMMVHYPADQIEATPKALLGSLSTISALTFVWVGALMSLSAYLILIRRDRPAEQQRAHSVAEVYRRTRSLSRTRDAVIFGLAKLADSRDPETGDHLERISVYSTLLASALPRQPRYRQEVTPAFIKLIGISAALHDIGKVGIPDRILLKSGELTEAERRQIQTHALIGGECLREIEQRLGSSNFLQMAREIAFGHHERWDGSGYPDGLAGEAIPLAARIVGLVDVYDALSSQRVYKPACPHAQCVAMIREQAGKHFDPNLVEVFLDNAHRFAEIAHRAATIAAQVAVDGAVELVAGGESLDGLAEDVLVAVPGEPAAAGTPA